MDSDRAEVLLKRSEQKPGQWKSISFEREDISRATTGGGEGKGGALRTRCRGKKLNSKPAVDTGTDRSWREGGRCRLTMTIADVFDKDDLESALRLRRKLCEGLSDLVPLDDGLTH